LVAVLIVYMFSGYLTLKQQLTAFSLLVVLLIYTFCKYGTPQFLIITKETLLD